ncbi:MAG TPA: hypothetical protein VF257_01200 [Solirubrobacteraceae bacterium]
MKGDRRSRRVALVSDSVLNPPPGAPDRLGPLADAGWGIIALPPPGLPDAHARAWRTAALDQAHELARHGLLVIRVLDGDDEAWLAPA